MYRLTYIVSGCPMFHAEADPKNAGIMLGTFVRLRKEKHKSAQNTTLVIERQTPTGWVKRITIPHDGKVVVHPRV